MTLAVDDLIFERRFSARRTTMGIIVNRDGSLVIASPPGTADDKLVAFIRAKKSWIYEKLEMKNARQAPIPKKAFVDGEGFHYLGKSHKLKIVVDQEDALRLHAGRFNLRRDQLGTGEDAFVKWYAKNAHAWIKRKVLEWAPRIGVEPKGIVIQDLGYRWGSCGKGNRLYFHWKSILLPPTLVEYVVVHELCHLVEPHHTPEFWALLDHLLPDAQHRKTWLAEKGMALVGV